MRKKSKRTKGIEEAHPFSEMSRIHLRAAGVDIGAIEIVACVSGDENTQMVKSLWELHGRSASPRSMAKKLRHQDGSDGKHRRVLDPLV